MIKWLHKLFCICDHQWVIIKEIGVIETVDGMEVDAAAHQVPRYFKMVLQCQHCGTVKVTKL